MPNSKYVSIYNNVKERLETEHLYLDPKLTLRKLSRIIGTNTVYLSRAINEGYGKTYKEVVNGYRVKYLMQLMRGTENNIEQLALRCGFGSRSTFYSAFMQYTGLSPHRYAEAMAKNNPH